MSDAQQRVTQHLGGSTPVPTQGSASARDDVNQNLLDVLGAFDTLLANLSVEDETEGFQIEHLFCLLDRAKHNIRTWNQTEAVDVFEVGAEARRDFRFVLKAAASAAGCLVEAEALEIVQAIAYLWPMLYGHPIRPDEWKSLAVPERYYSSQATANLAAPTPNSVAQADVEPLDVAGGKQA